MFRPLDTVTCVNGRSDRRCQIKAASLLGLLAWMSAQAGGRPPTDLGGLALNGKIA
jgi:hypothetical protein